jgi:hypothetical protein
MDIPELKTHIVTLAAQQKESRRSTRGPARTPHWQRETSYRAWSLRAAYLALAFLREIPYSAVEHSPATPPPFLWMAHYASRDIATLKAWVYRPPVDS